MGKHRVTHAKEQWPLKAVRETLEAAGFKCVAFGYSWPFGNDGRAHTDRGGKIPSQEGWESLGYLPIEGVNEFPGFSIRANPVDLNRFALSCGNSESSQSLYFEGDKALIPGKVLGDGKPQYHL